MSKIQVAVYLAYGDGRGERTQQSVREAGTAQILALLTELYETYREQCGNAERWQGAEGYVFVADSTTQSSHEFGFSCAGDTKPPVWESVSPTSEWKCRMKFALLSFGAVNIYKYLLAHLQTPPNEGKLRAVIDHCANEDIHTYDDIAADPCTTWIIRGDELPRFMEIWNSF